MRGFIKRFQERLKIDFILLKVSGLDRYKKSLCFLGESVGQLINAFAKYQTN
jgi:hypothetical protein